MGHPQRGVPTVAPMAQMAVPAQPPTGSIGEPQSLFRGGSYGLSSSGISASAATSAGGGGGGHDFSLHDEKQLYSASAAAAAAAAAAVHSAVPDVASVLSPSQLV